MIGFASLSARALEGVRHLFYELEDRLGQLRQFLPNKVTLSFLPLRLFPFGLPLVTVLSIDNYLLAPFFLPRFCLATVTLACCRSSLLALAHTIRITV